MTSDGSLNESRVIIMKKPKQRARRPSSIRGVTQIEVLVALSVLTIGLLAHASLVVNGHTNLRLNQDRRLALEGLRLQLERLRDFEFADCFGAFDEAAGNDPAVAPGPHFDIPGLQPSAADADGRVGRIVFPVAIPSVSAGLEPALTESVENPRLGMPADLDGDALIDDLPKDDTYVRLPVLVEARWEGPSGEQVARLRTWLVGAR